MRTIGLIGGMAWESTAEYYRLLNQEVARRLGGHHNAVNLLYTVDFATVDQMQRDGDWAVARVGENGVEGLGELIVTGPRRPVPPRSR